MSTTPGSRSRLKLNRPSLRARARPPKQRTQLGQAFSAVNLAGPLLLQHCVHCNRVQYPPRELCGHCLQGGLVWRDTDTAGTLINRIELHHSLWEYFKRRIKQAPWPIATVKLACGVSVFAHLALHTFEPTDIDAIVANTPVQVFSHSDSSLNAVLVAVSAPTGIASSAQRRAIMQQLGLLEPSAKEGGI